MPEIRRLTSEDWTVWRDLRLAALADAPESFGSTLAYWADAEESRWRRRLEEVPCNVVAFTGGEAVGQASGAYPDGAHSVELISVWVAPTHRGTDAAASLVTAVVAWAAGQQSVAVRLSVRKSNRRAIAFYRRMGFLDSVEQGDEPSEMAMLRPV